MELLTFIFSIALAIGLAWQFGSIRSLAKSG